MVNDKMNIFCKLNMTLASVRFANLKCFSSQSRRGPNLMGQLDGIVQSSPWCFEIWFINYGVLPIHHSYIS